MLLSCTSVIFPLPTVMLSASAALLSRHASICFSVNCPRCRFFAASAALLAFLAPQLELKILQSGCASHAFLSCLGCPRAQDALLRVSSAFLPCYCKREVYCLRLHPTLPILVYPHTQMSSSTTFRDLDEQIDRLLAGITLTENEVRVLCEKVYQESPLYAFFTCTLPFFTITTRFFFFPLLWTQSLYTYI